MSENFDPYLSWLGIEPHERPLDHYRLLGIERFEARREIIQAAADQRMGYIRSFQSGPRVKQTQRLLNELATAKLCLLDAGAKASYDAALRARLFPAPPAPVAYAQPAHYAQPMPPPAPGGHTGGYVPHMAEPPPPPVPPPAPAYVPPAPQGNENAGGPAPESPPVDDSPFYTRVWFPAAVGGALLLVAGLFWGTNKYLAHRRETAQARPPVEAPEPPTLEPETDPEPAPVVQAIIEPADNGSLVFSAAAAQLHGAAELGSHAGAEVVTNWKTTDEWLSWEFRVRKPGRFDMEISYSAQPDSEGSRYELVLGDERHRVDIRSGAKPDEFVTDKKTVFIRKSGRHTLSLRAADLRGKELFAFKSLTLTPRPTGGGK